MNRTVGKWWACSTIFLVLVEMMLSQTNVVITDHAHDSELRQFLVLLFLALSFPASIISYLFCLAIESYTTFGGNPLAMYMEFSVIIIVGILQWGIVLPRLSYKINSPSSKSERE